MRPSTILAAIIAIVVGLLIVVLVRWLRPEWFGLRPADAQAQPQPVAGNQILVAARNIYVGKCITEEDVRVRLARANELKQYEGQRLLPAYVPAAVGRVALKAIPADQPITEDALEPLDAYKEQLAERITPGMRTVNLQLPVTEAGGGLIRVGDYVDVLIKTTVEALPECLSSAELCRLGLPATMQGVLVRDARVIVRRNTLWPRCLNYLPCLTNFIVETDPYRAALLEYAKDRGTISLIPISDVERRLELEKRREAFRDDQGVFPTRLVNMTAQEILEYEASLAKLPEDDPKRYLTYHLRGSEEYRLENFRVRDVLRGERMISDQDLARILDLRLRQPPAPPPPTTVQRIVGVKPGEPHTFPVTVTMPAAYKLPRYEVLNEAGELVWVGEAIRLQYRPPEVVGEPETGRATGRSGGG
ncbi:MAG: Flp pilus assembly protein CpaB [Gemmatales bacterium]|nr:Flp pilus assembly protein CpaB [Gemmatales bacterium]MDW7994471.1 Flp pilus assembly protein CpaB [Gemmatales bacterium]